MPHHRREEVRARLARAHGHLHAVMSMIDEDKPYPEILRQIGAVRAALDKAAAVGLADMVDACEPPAGRDATRRFEELRAGVAAIL